MSIYVKDMEMPTTGLYFVGVDNSGGRDKTVVTVERMLGNRDVRQVIGSFELVHVPPHGRLGDLDKLEQMFVDIDNAPYSGFDGSEPFYSAEDAAQIIRLAPTIIPASEEE